MDNMGKTTRQRRKVDWMQMVSDWRELLKLDYPSETEYPDSLWALWDNRVQAAHEAEEEQISQQLDALKKGKIDEDLLDDDDSRAVRQHWEVRRLTYYMYAALVVAMWSRMEDLLRTWVCACRRALDLPGKRLYGIKEIKESFQEDISIELDTCKEYKIVDAIRILNNTFKHDRGEYDPEAAKERERIDETLLKKWAILDCYRIKYCKIPVKELALGCGSFCHDLLHRIELVLEERIGKQACS